MVSKIMKGGGKRLSVFEVRKERAQNIIFFTGYFIWFLILILFTPFTNNLDEIKVMLLYFFGPALIVLYLYYQKNKLTSLLSPIFLYPLLLYILVMVISTLLSKFPWVGVFVTGSQLGLLGFYLIFFAAHKNVESIEKGFYLITIFSLFTTLFGLFHYLGGFNVIYQTLYGDPDKVLPAGYFQNLVYTFLKSREMFSTILNRDFYASLLVMLIPITIASAMVIKDHKKLSISIITLILMFICLFLALSKDSFAGLILTLFIYIVLYKRYSHLSGFKIPYFKVLFIGLTVILLTLIFFQSNTMFGKLKSFDVNIKSREIIWGGGMNIFYKYPIWGGGPGTFRVLFPQFRSPEHYLYDISNVTVYAHNRYIDLLCETGILGFITYMAFIIIIFYKSFKQIRFCKDEKLKIFQIALFSGIIGILFTNFFSPNSRWTVVGTSFWAILGLSTACYCAWETGSQSVKPKVEQIIKRLILISFIAIALLLIYKIYYYAVIKGKIDWSLFFTICCFIFSIPFIYGLVQFVFKKSQYFLQDVVIVFFMFVAVVSSVFSILYFMGAYYNSEGLMRLGINRHEEAVEFFQKAIKYNPSFSTSYYKMAHSYHALGETEKSLESYLKLAQYQPDYAEIHYNLGVLNTEVAQDKFQKNDTERAIKHLKEAVSEYEIAAKMSSKATIQFALAIAYVRSYEMLKRFEKEPILMKEYQEKAVKVFEKMFERPNPPPGNQYYAETIDTKSKAEPILAQLYFSMNEYSKAEKLYLKLWKQSPDNINYQMRILECQQLSNEKNETSIKFMKDSLKYNPLNAQTHLMLAKLYMNADNQEEGLRHAKIAYKLDPNSASVQELIKKASESPSPEPAEKK